MSDIDSPAAAEVRTACPYCGVGCGVLAKVAADGTPSVRGDPDHPANFGKLCSKGSALGETMGLDGRVLHPEIGGKRADWDAALDLVARKFSETIATHGPDAVGFYVSGQLLTEDYYVANKLMKGFIGSANIDTNSRLCMASSVAGHRRAFGEDIVPGVYKDFEQADLVVLTGSNTAWCHPILYQRLLAARKERGTKIVVIDPRRTATADECDLHLAIDPGTDVLLFNGLLAYLIRMGTVDAEFIGARTTRFDEAAALAVADAPSVAEVAKGCGLDQAAVAGFFDLFASIRNAVTVYSQGVNQSAHGTDKVNAIINCHLATGRIGKSGMGPFSVTGQPNAMGGREVGGLANQLAAHMGFRERRRRRPRIAFLESAQHRPARRPEGGRHVPRRRRGAHQGAVDHGHQPGGLDAGCQPRACRTEGLRLRRRLRCYAHRHHAFCRCASARRWLGREGRHGHQFGTPHVAAKAVHADAGRGARRLAHHLRCRHAAWATAAPSPFVHRPKSSASMPRCRASKMTGERLFDIGGLAGVDEAAYENFEPRQWPASKKQATSARLLGDGRFPTPDGRARFVPVRQEGPALAVDAAFPIVLNTGRLRDQWHTMTRTGSVPRLTANAPEPMVDLHPVDAAANKLKDGDLAHLSTRYGFARAKVRVTDAQRPGQAFLPMHWSGNFAANASAGTLSAPIVDPFSGQPELKHVPVRISREATAWSGVLITRRDLRPTGFVHWSRCKVDGGWVYELGGTETPDQGILLARGFLDPFRRDQLLEYKDRRGLNYRAAVVDQDGTMAEALLVAPPGQLPEREWLLSLLASRQPLSTTDRMALLSGRSPRPTPSVGRIVCSCFNVGANQLASAVATGCSTVEAIGAQLRAGTNCGSCRSEIRSIIDAGRVQAAE